MNHTLASASRSDSLKDLRIVEVSFTNYKIHCLVVCLPNSIQWHRRVVGKKRRRRWSGKCRRPPHAAARGLATRFAGPVGWPHLVYLENSTSILSSNLWDRLWRCGLVKRSPIANFQDSTEAAKQRVGTGRADQKVANLGIIVRERLQMEGEGKNLRNWDVPAVSTDVPFALV